MGDGTINPAYFAGGYIPDLIVSEKFAKELLEETFAELIDVEYEEPYSKRDRTESERSFCG